MRQLLRTYSSGQSKLCHVVFHLGIPGSEWIFLRSNNMNINATIGRKNCMNRKFYENYLPFSLMHAFTTFKISSSKNWTGGQLIPTVGSLLSTSNIIASNDWPVKSKFEYASNSGLFFSSYHSQALSSGILHHHQWQLSIGYLELNQKSPWLQSTWMDQYPQRLCWYPCDQIDLLFWFFLKKKLKNSEFTSKFCEWMCKDHHHLDQLWHNLCFSSI